jgi:hypothetical protein
MMQVWEIILGINMRMGRFDVKPGDVAWQSQEKQAKIHRIDDIIAKKVAALLKHQSTTTFIPLSTVLAIMTMESKFDPKAENHNGQPDWKRWDVGSCQLNLGVLSREATLGLTSYEACRDFALNIDTAIPWKFQIILRNLKAAKKYIEKKGIELDPWYLMLEMYNKGPTGAVRRLEAGEPMSYANLVQTHENDIRGRLQGK